MADPFDKYRHCPMCGKLHDKPMQDWAIRLIEEKPCSPECLRRDIIRRFACCDKATFLPCVCMYAFHCDEHGDRHIGTHD